MSRKFTLQSPKTTVQDWWPNVDPHLTLKEAIEKYRDVCGAGDKQQQYRINTVVNKLFKEFSPVFLVKNISSGNVKNNFIPDAQSFVNKMLEYLRTGQVFARDESTETLSFVSAKSKISDLVKYWPLSGMNGRFVNVKAEVQHLVNTVSDDEWGVLRVPKGELDDKEITQITRNVKLWLNKNRMQWSFQWSPLGKFFIVARRSDLSKMLKEGKNGI